MLCDYEVSYLPLEDHSKQSRTMCKKEVSQFLIRIIHNVFSPYKLALFIVDKSHIQGVSRKEPLEINYCYNLNAWITSLSLAPTPSGAYLCMEDYLNTVLYSLIMQSNQILEFDQKHLYCTSTQARFRLVVHVSCWLRRLIARS